MQEKPGIYLKLKSGKLGYMPDTFYTGWRLSGAFIAHRAYQQVDPYYIDCTCVDDGTPLHVHHDEIVGITVKDLGTVQDNTYLTW